MNCKTCNKPLPSYAYICKIEYCSEECRRGKKEYVEQDIDDLFWWLFKEK